MNSHPIPLIWIGADRPFKPLRHAQCVFADLGFVPLSAYQFELWFDNQLQLPLRATHEVGRHDSRPGPQCERRGTPPSKDTAPKKGNENSTSCPIFIGDQQRKSIASQHPREFAYRFRAGPGMNGFLADFKSVVVHKLGKLSMTWLIHHNMNRIALKGKAGS